MKRLLIVAGALAVLAGAPLAAQDSGGHRRSSDGKQVFQRANCVGCHKWHGAGGGGYGGDALSLRATQLDRDQIIETVTCGRPGTGMPYFQRGAYDGEATYAAAAARQRHPPPDVVVPPRASAVPSAGKGDGDRRNQRDRHIRLMAERGRMGWQQAAGYGRRNQAETAIFRYKHLISPRLHPRSLPAQRGEAAIVVAVLNTMTRTAKPVSVRVA